MPESLNLMMGIAFIAVWLMVGHNLVRTGSTAPSTTPVRRSQRY